MPDLSLLRTDSRASRCVMFSMPTSKYHMNGKVNETLQKLYTVMTADLNDMATRGVRTKHGVPYLKLNGSWLQPNLVNPKAPKA